MAPLCTTPAPLCTYPEIEPGVSAASAGSASPKIPNRLEIFRNITTTSGVKPDHFTPRQILLHGKCRRRVHGLLRDVVVHLDLDLVQTGFEVRGRKALLQRDLFPDVPHLLGRFGR